MTDFIEREWTTPDGVRLAARDYAASQDHGRLPVICLHGLTRNARDFEALAPAIAASGRRVLAMDMRGRGRSAFDPELSRYALPTYVTDVAGFAQALGVERAVFVGTSMGGLITMGLTYFAPALVAAAVLNDVGPEVSPAGLARIVNQFEPGLPINTWADAADYSRRVNGLAFPNHVAADWEPFARRLFRDQDGVPVLDYDRAIIDTLKAAPVQAAPDLWPLFDAMAADRPLLVVRGELSDVLAADVAERMADRAPDLRVCTVNGVGHAPGLTEPEALEAILQFLSRVV